MGLTLSDTINAIDYGSLTLVYKCPLGIVKRCFTQLWP